jgi:hypothetical protein
MGPDSGCRLVTSIASGRETMYKVVDLQTQEFYIVNKSHILCFSDSTKTTGGGVVIKEGVVGDLFESLGDSGLGLNGVRTCVEFSLMPDEQLYSKTEYLDNPELLKAARFYSKGIRQDIIELFINFTGRDYSFIWTSKQVSEYLIFIARSLGHHCLIKVIDNTTIGIETPESFKPKQVFEISISNARHRYSEYPIQIVELKVDDYYGFEITGDRRFVLGDLSVTHNTRICRCLSSVLGLPFNQFSFGSIKDAAHLVGHSSTYVSARYGAVSANLIKSECMNPIFYLDEIDKIPMNGNGESSNVSNVLLHLLDKEQNSEFVDEYFSEDAKLDLSRVFFIASFNNPETIDPILRNRINIIKIPKLSLDDKVQIVKHVSLPDILKKINIKSSDFTLDDTLIKYIIQNKTQEEDGMRLIENSIDKIFTKINTTLILKNCESFNKSLFVYQKLCDLLPIYSPIHPIKITQEMIDIILTPNSERNAQWMSMYS